MRKTIIVAGAAGTGINTVQSFLELLLKRSGFHLLSYRNYMSRIRGGFSYTAITASDTPVYAVEGMADILLALDRTAVAEAGDLMKPNGLLVAYDTDLTTVSERLSVLSLDSGIISTKIIGKSALSMSPLGVALRFMGIPEENLLQISAPKWTAEMNQDNLTAAQWGYNQIDSVCAPPNIADQHILVTGNQAVALGALSAGLGFFSAYPMAPSTGIMNYLSSNEEKMQIIVEQAEDEIAALIAVIGAASNGVRSMTGTSGGGFSLMAEGLGFAAISETPVVIANVQRPGPATGSPTRTEQGDLSFVVHASQGEFPRLVIAPASVEACFYDTFRAFNLADRFQIPVILLTDQQLGDATKTTVPFDCEGLEIQRGVETDVVADYKRYDYSRIEGGRKYPGLDDTLIMTDSHVHDAYGAMSEKADDAVHLKNKFLRRMEEVREVVTPPYFEGKSDADNVFVCWGSSYGVVKEALAVLTERGHSVAMLHYTDVFPLNSVHVAPWITGSRRIINVELNAFNQFGKLLHMETGLQFTHTINRYDGRPFVIEDILSKFEVIING